MTHLNSRLCSMRSSQRWLLAVFVVFSLLSLSSYRSEAADSTPEATATAIATEATVGTDAGTDVTAQGTSSPVEVDFGPGSFNLTAPTAGLAALSSYQATLILTFKGTNAGQPEAWSRTWVMLASQKPAIRQLTIDTTGDNIGIATDIATAVATSDATGDAAGNIPAHVFLAEMNGARYQLQGPDACIASVIEQGNSLAETLEPAGFLTSVIGADAAGADTVNGVVANHYTFDERAIGQTGIAHLKGELWVATDGGYLVKYTVVTTGSADYIGENAEGTVTWDYELTNVNQPVDIKLPANCPAGLVDAPLLPDATDVLKQPGMLSYSTASSVTDVTDFYTKQIPTLGWQALDAPAVTDTSTLLGFTQGSQQLSVIISAADGSTRVQIFLEAAFAGTSAPLTVPSPTPRPTRTPVPSKTPVPTRTPSNTKMPTPTRTPAS